jgi:[glutamine synthetase] adenylyltransferase / [glutamine synthetase]-adenylyl-L-tyrosine phosphorylase
VSGRPPAPVTGTLADTISWGRISEPDARTQSIWQDLVTRTAANPDLTHLSSIFAHPNVAAVMTAILAGSPYLQGLIVRDGARLQRLLATVPEQRLADLIAGLRSAMAQAADVPAAMVLLRRFKAEVALLCALADLGGVWPVMTVTDALTQAADAAVRTAVRALFSFAQARGHWHAERAEAGETG